MKEENTIIHSESNKKKRNYHLIKVKRCHYHLIKGKLRRSKKKLHAFY